MAEKQNLVEEALIQMKSLENVVSENAKGILASTMKEEISELVKESLETEDDSEFDSYMDELGEQDELDTEMDDEEEDDNELPMDDEFDDEEDSLEDEEFEFPTMDDEDEEPIDLTNASDEEILKVFKAMGDQDGIIIKKDGDTIDLEDTDADVEYKIQIGESEEEEEDSLYMDMEEEDEMDMDMTMDMEEEDEMDMDMTMDMEEEDEMGMTMDMEDEDELMFEIEMDDFEEIGDEFSNDDEEDFSFEFTEDEDEDAEVQKMEATEGFKAKGVGMGKAKFSYNKPTGGFKEKMKHANPTKGTGKPKFEFKEGGNMTGMKKPMMKKPMMVKGGETTEASRTLGNGKRWGRNGLDKPKAAPQHLRVEGLEKELVTLRERNEEYRKALNIFRTKLNEVAVFNSNLAYATRLFTEHSTTKNEKINILRRFDSVESLKESKSLYKTVKDELGNQGGTTVVKESFQHKIEKTPASGSAINLMESKTYENPQFMRMKDLMTKMNVVK